MSFAVGAVVVVDMIVVVVVVAFNCCCDLLCNDIIFLFVLFCYFFKYSDTNTF